MPACLPQREVVEGGEKGESAPSLAWQMPAVVAHQSTAVTRVHALLSKLPAGGHDVQSVSEARPVVVHHITAHPVIPPGTPSRRRSHPRPSGECGIRRRPASAVAKHGDVACLCGAPVAAARVDETTGPVDRLVEPVRPRVLVDLVRICTHRTCARKPAPITIATANKACEVFISASCRLAFALTCWAPSGGFRVYSPREAGCRDDVGHMIGRVLRGSETMTRSPLRAAAARRSAVAPKLNRKACDLPHPGISPPIAQCFVPRVSSRTFAGRRVVLRPNLQVRSNRECPRCRHRLMPDWCRQPAHARSQRSSACRLHHPRYHRPGPAPHTLHSLRAVVPNSLRRQR